MGWDPTPWFLGGGAEHSPEVARLLAYAATSGAEGIVTPGDLKVVPLTPAGTSVRVLVGAALILGRALNGTPTQQTYVARMASADTVAISATSSGSGRTDLIVAEIMDPYTQGSTYQAPADPKVGPYVRTQVLSNTTTVPTGMQAIPLARIEIPAGTSTITEGMIKDMRQLAQPRSKTYKFSAQPNTAILPRGSSFVRWPSYRPTVTIPTWATWVSMSVILSGVGAGGNVDGFLRAAVGDVIGGSYIIDIDTAASRETLVVTCSGWITPSDKGRTVELITEGYLYPTSPAQIGTNPGSQVLYDIAFEEYAV